MAGADGLRDLTQAEIAEAVAGERIDAPP